MIGKRYLIIVILFFSIVNMSCESQINTPIERFNSELSKGYAFGNSFKKVVVNRRKVISVCVFGGKANAVAKETIDKYFDFLQVKLQFIINKLYTNSLKQCHPDTDMYIYLHEGKNVLNVQEHWQYIQKSKRMRVQKIAPNMLAHASFRREKNKTVAFVVVNQFSFNLDNPIIVSALKSIIIQELFQSTVFGSDIQVNKTPFSILHEFYEEGVNIQKDYSPWSFKKHFEKNPSGLCTVDIWFLMLKARFANDDVLTSDPSEYKHFFRRNMREIMSKTNDIQSNPIFKGLFDPRCNGKNAGINTKIGIQ